MIKFFKKNLKKGFNLSKLTNKQFSNEIKNEIKVEEPDFDAPKYDSMEFEPFKFDYERSQLSYGYTIMELYGSKVGVSHSPAIKKEMYKDNVMIALTVALGVFLLYRSGQKDSQLDEAWENYFYTDCNTYRKVTPKQEYK